MPLIGWYLLKVVKMQLNSDKEKNREGLAAKLLAANAGPAGMFGPTIHDQQAKAQLGWFG